MKDASRSTMLLASTTLRNIMGTKQLTQILADRETTAKEVLQQLNDATDHWGIKVSDRRLLLSQL